MVLESDENHEDFSGNIIEAQVEANKLVDEIEASAIESNDESDGNEALAPMPKLLQLSQEKLLEKTNDLKAKGNQLDLLLLKAESYSHFIKQNQDRFRTTLLERQKEAESMNSPSKVKAGAVSNKSLMKDSEYLQPSNLEGGKLMPHQLEALQWLLSLWENGLSGILADEMGLGKTIEVIALISQLKLSNASGPFMVIGPLATITNWLKEFKKWLPSCDVLLYHGTKQEREEMRKNRFNISNRDTAKCTGLGDTKFPVIITSFEICMIDRPYLMHYDWKFMVLDEGHRIKNRNCRLVQELKAIPCVTRLLLTGTPIQNTLEELWSLLNFVNPTIFDDLECKFAYIGLYYIF